MTETDAMPINAPCRRVAALNCGPHPLVVVEFRRHFDDGTSKRGSVPRPMPMPSAHRVAHDLVEKLGRVDVWFTIVGRVG